MPIFADSPPKLVSSLPEQLPSAIETRMSDRSSPTDHESLVKVGLVNSEIIGLKWDH